VFGTYTVDNDESDGEDDDPYSLGASYKAGNIYAFASYLTTQAGGDDEATQFGLKYTFGDAAVWGMYEIDGGLISGDKDADIFNIGASYTIGNNLVSFDYAEGAESDNNAVPEYTTWRLGGYHKFSNRTRVYATFAQVDVDNAGEVDVFSLGLRHNF
jgi:predicted porin